VLEVCITGPPQAIVSLFPDGKSADIFSQDLLYGNLAYSFGVLLLSYHRHVFVLELLLAKIIRTGQLVK